MRDLAYGNLNLSTDTWGPEADRFDPDRFLKMESHDAASTGQIDFRRRQSALHVVRFIDTQLMRCQWSTVCSR